MDLQEMIKNYQNERIKKGIGKFVEYSQKENIGRHYFLLATRFLDQNEIGKAYEYFKQALDIVTCDCQSGWSMISKERMKSIFDDLNVKNKIHYEYYFVKAYVFSYEEDEMSKYLALDAINKYLEVKDDDYGHYVKGKILLGLKQFNEALQSFETAMKHGEKSRLLYRIGRTREQFLKQEGLHFIYNSFLLNTSSPCCVRFLKEYLKLKKNEKIRCFSGDNFLVDAFNDNQDDIKLMLLYERTLSNEIKSDQNESLKSSEVIIGFIEALKGNSHLFINDREKQNSDEDEVEFPECETCGDSNDVTDPGGDYWLCSHCNHAIDGSGACVSDECETCVRNEYLDEDEDIQEEVFPECQTCGDSNDVTDPEGEYWWCSHCNHDIDANGKCVSEECETCESDETDENYEDRDEDPEEFEFPECQTCCDSGDVINPGGDYWWCTFCKHSIDTDGNCVSDECEKCKKSILNDKKGPFYLFFDTETTGVPKDWNAPISFLDNWPRIVQIAWLICDRNGDVLVRREFVIKPSGFKIPVEASQIHGITTEHAEECGISILDVLLILESEVRKSKYLIAHNINFDSKVTGSEYIRNLSRNPLADLEHFCTMESSTGFCKIPGRFGYKWPKLSELHQKLFGFDFEGAHDALADIEATAKCFWEMRKLGVI